MNNNNKSGFTLVELIVVIIVLSILSTLGFISYQWHWADARDAKRKSDIWNLTKQLELKKIEWEELFSFVLNDTSSIWIDIKISWYDWSLELDWDYKAWDTDFVYLELVWENFTDPLTGDFYKIWVTSYQKRYEVAGSIEQKWEHSSYVDGTWYPRSTNETQVEINKTIWNTVYLSGSTKSDLLLYAWDTVTIGWSLVDKYIITRTFNSKLQLDKNVITPWNTIELYVDETSHIIKSWSWDYSIQTNSWTLFTPYNLEP